VKSVLEEIGRQLAQIGTSGSFATRRTATADDLNLEVQDVGRIRLPVTTSTARRLCEVARPARHGFKDETHLDRRVRDTWEIPKSRIFIDEPRWMRTLTAQLDRIRRDLGLPEGCWLKAQLHNMLVYAPGQFFVPHQDSEKTDDMIGTLVVSLPSRFSGGAMALEHHNEKMLVRGSNNRLTLVAFYADCHHEVRPIRQGHRIVLTYNLIVEGDATAADPPAQVEALAPSIRKFFETPRPPRWSGDRRQGPPDRLVYLLDHEYTQRGLAWNRLKNADAQRAAALQEVARQLECEIFLALADVHETWSCEEEYRDYRGYGRRSRWSHDHDGNDDESENEPFEPELTELIDSDIELRHWIGAAGRREAVATNVDAGELCYTKPSAELKPFETDHEGYTGNAGNTVEHWYHRAAVVLWPRERTFIIRAKAAPLWGIGEVAKTLKAGNAVEASALARRLLPFWPQVAGRADRRGLLEATVKVAAKLDDPTVAAILLRPFALIGLTPKAAPQLANLLDSYGLDWCRRLLRNWESERADEAQKERLLWMGSVLPALCQSLCVRDSSDGQSLAQWILKEQWAWLLDHLKQLREYVSDRERLKELSRLCKPILSLMESSRIARQPDLHAQVIEFLTGGARDLPVHVPLGMLQAAHKHRQSRTLRSLGLKAVHMHCTQDLTTRLNAPVRANDDWSIAASVRCSCKLCVTLTRYLRAQGEVWFEWPLAKAERAHIHGIVDSHDLPVTHITRRTGRPFTLILEKTAAVFEREAVERRLWQSALQWLTKTAADF
jgi:2OG-Fe(II) oxygenase superfamily